MFSKPFWCNLLIFLFRKQDNHAVVFHHHVITLSYVDLDCPSSRKLSTGGPHQLKRPTILQGIGSIHYDLGWPNHTSDFCGTKTSSDMACRSIGTDGVGSPAIWSRGVLPKGSCLLLGTGAWKTKLLRHATTSKHQRHKIYSIFPGYLLPRVGGRREKECPKFKYAQCSGHNF